MAGGAAAQLHQRLRGRREDGDFGWGQRGGWRQGGGGRRRWRGAGDVQSSEVDEGVEIICGVTPCSGQEKSTTRREGKRLRANPTYRRNYQRWFR